MFKLSSLLVLAASATNVAADRSFTVANKCSFTIWPAIFGSPAMSQATGWEAASGSTITLRLGQPLL
ncbi:hypothetical protein EWM64_g9969 [Hericium alpestre]|uniref:Uncharacterized protein n=1 Tax=Hericium alpestre TaxID=135208 RepID=A0A4Y9ZJH9_9AGAM|nr:hypothetical protein EWM64_g9969 [Hericium alpestre]